MPNTTAKRTSDLSHENVLRAAANEHDGSINVNGFLAPIVGRKIQQVISTTTVAGDTATLTFSENGLMLYVYRIIYTDAVQATMISAERIA